MGSDQLPALLRNLRSWRELWQNDGVDMVGDVHILDVEAAVATLPDLLRLPILHQLVLDRPPARVAFDLRISRALLRTRVAEGLEILARELAVEEL